MMMLVSARWRSPSLSIGNFASGHCFSHSATYSGVSGPRQRKSKGVAFSYRATSSFRV